MSFFSNLWNTYQQGLEYPKLVESYQELAKTLDTERKQFTSVITELENENILLYNDLEECSLDLAETNTVDPQSTFSLKTTLSNLKKKIESRAYKYPYKGNGRSYDIKYALTVKDQSIIDAHAGVINAKYQPKTPTECVEAVSKYFIYEKKPTYVTDIEQFNKRDYWLPADKFLYTWRGDCEDTAIAAHLLIKKLLELTSNEEHYDRLYLCISSTYVEAHAYNIWLHEDGYFYVIESTIDAKGTFKRKWLKTPLANDSMYFDFAKWGFANLNGSHKGSNAITGNFL